jgi:hypothetical protein
MYVFLYIVKYKVLKYFKMYGYIEMKNPSYLLFMNELFDFPLRTSASKAVFAIEYITKKNKLSELMPLGRLIKQ